MEHEKHWQFRYDVPIHVISDALSKKGNGVHFSRFIVAFVVLAILVSAVGCGGGAKKIEIKNKVPLVKVHGIIHVNGAPRKNVLVILSPRKPIAETRKQYSNLSNDTNENGEFRFTTYESYDGVPVCEYGLYAVWKVNKTNPTTGRSELVDHFERKYSQKESPVMTFTATDAEVDLGVIELQADTLPPNP